MSVAFAYKSVVMSDITPLFPHLLLPLLWTLIVLTIMASNFRFRTLTSSLTAIMFTKVDHCIVGLFSFLAFWDIYPLYAV